MNRKIIYLIWLNVKVFNNIIGNSTWCTHFTHSCYGIWHSITIWFNFLVVNDGICHVIPTIGCLYFKHKMRMIVHLNLNFLCRTHSVPSQRARDCDVFFNGVMNNQATLSTMGATESLKDGEVEGGGATQHAVLTLTWFAWGRRCCQICARSIRMPPWDAKLLQEQRKSNLCRVCLESNHIPLQQAHWSIIAWERSCQVALKSSGPLTVHVHVECW